MDPVVYENIGWKLCLLVANLKVDGKIGVTWVINDPSHASVAVLIESYNQANGRATVRPVVMPLCNDKVTNLQFLPFDPH